MERGALRVGMGGGRSCFHKGETMDELKVGDKLKDNDPRMGNRVLEVLKAHPDGAVIVARTPLGREVNLLRNRIYTDGKPRRTGYSRVWEAR